MSISEDENFEEMIRDFFESETPHISQTSSKPTINLSLQETLERCSVFENEVLEKILVYLKEIEVLDQIADHDIKEWIVMRLQMDHYEASLCKSSWVSTFGPPFAHFSTLGRPSVFKYIGDYEYIDVMMKDEEEIRLIVDLDFRDQFEVARPTEKYIELMNLVPSIFVGSEEKLKEIIYLICSAAKKSFKESGLHIPPWRKASYMQSKWLSHNCQKTTFPHIKEPAIF